MLFNRIVFNALAMGLVAGLIFSLVQLVGVTPIIQAAEKIETLPASHEHMGANSHHQHPAQHHHGDGQSTSVESWSPENGIERTVYTFISNIFAGIGFAAVLLSLMCLFQLHNLTGTITPKRGVLWGAAGFIVFFVAPGLGLPPGIPGMESAAVENRQLWWLSAVLAAGVGIALIWFAPPLFKVLGVAVVTAPYWVQAPQPAGPPFYPADADVAATLSVLHSQFIVAAGVSNFIFWLVLGTACAWALNNKIFERIQSDETSGV